MGSAAGASLTQAPDVSFDCSVIPYTKPIPSPGTSCTWGTPLFDVSNSSAGGLDVPGNGNVYQVKLRVGATTGPMQLVVLEMAKKRFGCVGIVDARGALTGIITDGDLARHMDRTLLDRKPAEVMTRAPKTFAADFHSYWQAQRQVDAVWRDSDEWARMSIRNIAGMGWFSADRAIGDYAKSVWHARF